MSRLTARQRRRIPKSSFGLPSKRTKENKAGRGAYPVNDRTHAIAAKAYAKRFATPSEQAKIDAKANKMLHADSTPVASPQKPQNAFDKARAYLKRIKGR